MRRVGLTTTRDRIQALAASVASYGMEPVSTPCIEISFASEDTLEEARGEAERCDWIFVTSARAIDALWPDGGMPRTPVAAVGPATASAVEDAGGALGVVGREGAAQLLAEIEGRLADRRVLFPHASGSGGPTIDGLSRSAREILPIAVYETRPVAPPDEAVDAVMFGSPSAVTGWCLARSLDGLVLAAIGETTKSALEARGHEADVVAPEPVFETLAALLADHLRERSSV